MNPTTGNQPCAREGCTCHAADGAEFCSENCRSAAATGSDASCECRHAACVASDYAANATPGRERARAHADR